MEKKEINSPTTGTVLGGITNPGRKNIVRITIGILLIIVIVGISFAYWNNTTSQKTKNVVKSTCLKLEIEDISAPLTIEDAQPISEEEAESLPEYRFKVKNECNTNVSYNINIEILENVNKLRSEFIAVKFNNQDKKILNTFTPSTPTHNQEGEVADEAYMLGSDVLGANKAKEYTIKLWMDEAVESIEAMDKTFESKITVTGEVLKGEILSEKASVGDYVSMRPTSTSYTIEGSKTGCTDTSYCNGVTDQTINPSELDLWRVIKKNEDGTIEMVSEYTSNEEVYFYGKEGYKNYVGTLNEIASSYENDTYTIGSRYMGYDGQTEVLTVTDEELFTYPAPWTTSTDTHGNQYESQGGGDMLYQSDVDLVQNTIGSLVANKNKTTEKSDYWIASRVFYYNSVNYFGWNIRNIDNNQIYDVNMYVYRDNLTRDNRGMNFLRPIIILKSNIILSEGMGTSESPWVLQ